jgi:NADH:ubiquinone oxidoreductase subunit 4 (subunit M)
MVSQHLLTLTIFLPLFGVLALFFVNKENGAAIKLVGFLTTVATFAVSLFLYFRFDASVTGFQFR